MKNFIIDMMRSIQLTSSISRGVSSLIVSGMFCASMTIAEASDLLFQDSSLQHTMGCQKVENDDNLSYSINLMWTNPGTPAIEGEKFVFPHDKINPVRLWAAGNPNAEINFWYDSEYMCQMSLNRLIMQLLREFNHQIILKDIRSLELVQQNSEIFSTELPIYFIVDLLRVITADQEALTGKARYFVYSDLNVTPLTKDELFDEKTLTALKRFGLVLPPNKAGGDRSFPFENGFFIMDLQRKSMLRAHRLALIDMNIVRAKQALNDAHWKSDTSFKTMKELIFSSYGDMYKCFYFFEGKVQFIDEKQQSITINPDTAKATDILNLNKPGFKYGSNITYYDWVVDRETRQYVFGEKTGSEFPRIAWHPLIKQNVNKPVSKCYEL